MLLPYIWRPGATAEEAERRDHVPYRDWARAGFLQLCDGDIINYSDVEEAIQQAGRTTTCGWWALTPI